MVVTDEQGREFDNISSLEYDWHVSDKGLGDLDSQEIKHKTSKLKDGASKFTCKQECDMLHFCDMFNKS